MFISFIYKHIIFIHIVNFNPRKGITPCLGFELGLALSDWIDQANGLIPTTPNYINQFISRL